MNLPKLDSKHNTIEPLLGTLQHDYVWKNEPVLLIGDFQRGGLIYWHKP